jgi:indolepyruvate ferredoxin oxidoreductase, alpha subunit
MSELLLGDEAVGLAAIDAGISGMFGYPGTPSTEIFEFVQQRTKNNGKVIAQWSANEKVAYEEAMGMSFAGKRALISMKHVGLNVAMDPFMSSALTGARGGMVLAVADDPGMHSSQNEQDSRVLGDFASIPMFEPCNQQEAYDMVREAFEYSERIAMPMIVRLVTRLAHSRARVQPAPAAIADPIKIPFDWRHWTLLPVNARVRYRRVIDLVPKMREYSEHSPFNQLELRGPKGIITTGIAYNYVREVIGFDSEYSLLKITTYPAPFRQIRDLVAHCQDVLIIEEGYPYLETQINGALGVPGRAIRGKRSGALRMDGEMTVERVRAALGMQALPTLDVEEGLPSRPPRLCDGCPHCDTFRALVEAVEKEPSALMLSDIGCYTLGALPPYNAVHTCVDMGASISMSLGAAKAGAHPVIATIGDSTFTHSGMTGLLCAICADADMTVIILDNAITAMTGGQDILASGEDLIALLKGLGVKEEHLVTMEPMPKHHAENVQLLRREINHRGLSVVVAYRGCIQSTRKAVQATAEARKQAAVK